MNDIDIQNIGDIRYFAGGELTKYVYDKLLLLDRAIDALRLQELCSTMQKEYKSGMFIKADDPRYTEWIGEWNGYQAPETRYNELNYFRQQVRRNVLGDFDND